MSNRMGLDGVYAVGYNGSNSVERKGRNKHTENYDDDGLVITMTLTKFFSAYRDYAGFLNGGARAYISLTDDMGQEAFQFSLLTSFNAPAERDVQFSCVIKGGRPSHSVQALVGTISKTDEPMLLESKTGAVYGVLYPSVVLDTTRQP